MTMPDGGAPDAKGGPTDFAPIPLDLRLLGIGLNESEAALVDSQLVVLHERLYAQLFALGIAGKGVNGRGPFDALGCDVVVFLPNRRFEFAPDMRDATGSCFAVIIPAHDEYAEIIDLVALDLDTGRIATWRGMASMLGQDDVASSSFGEPMTVHEKAIDWLRAGRTGLFIIDPTRARKLLDGQKLAVARTAFGVALFSALRSEPEIVVREVAQCP